MLWNYREPVASTHTEKDDVCSNRVVELACTFLLRVKKSKLKIRCVDDESVIAHHEVVDKLPTDCLICYTDGSASPTWDPLELVCVSSTNWTLLSPTSEPALAQHQ